MKKIIRIIKDNSALIIIICFALFIRILSLKNIFVADESFFYSTIFNKLFSLHPPIYFLLQKLFIVPNVFWTARLVPLIFGIMNIILVYILSIKIFDKKTAIFSSLLMTFSFWPVLASSMVDINGSLIMFEYLLTFIVFINYLKTNKNKFLILTGMLIGLSSITKYMDTLILIAILGLIHLYEKKDIKKSIKFGAAIVLIGIIIYSLFPLLSYLLGYWPQFISTLENTSLAHKGLTLRPFIYLIFWATPMLGGLFLLSLLKFEKKKIYFVIWTAAVFLLYFFIVGASRLPYERYLMTMIPPLCILGGNYLSKFNFKAKQTAIGVISLLVFYITLLYLNLRTRIFMPHSVSNYIYAIKNLKFNFMYPYVGSSGPSFWISFNSMILIVGLACIFLLFYMILAKNKKLSSIFFILFISSSLSFNVFLIQEHTLSLANPNINKVAYDVIDFYNSNNLNRNVFITDYLSSIGIYLKDANVTKAKVGELNKLNFRNSTLIIIDFPTLDKSGEFWKEINKCEKVYTSKDKGMELGWIYKC